MGAALTKPEASHGDRAHIQVQDRAEPCRQGFWHEIAGNGEIIGTSGQDFFSQEDAKRAVENAKASAAAAPVEVSNHNQAMNELIRRMMAEREERSVMRSVEMLTGAHQQKRKY